VALLAALLSTPTELIKQYVGADFAQTTFPHIIRPILKALVGLSIARALNKALNSLATNNWRTSSSPPVGRWEWPKEIAVVTGGCNGIGQALVEGLVARGVRVAILDVSDPPPAMRSNPKVTYFKCDVTSLQQVAETADAIRVSMGGEPTILINNAGIARFNSVLDIPEQALRQVLGVNLMALWFTTKQFLPAMIKENKGHIVTVASLASFIALPMSIEYSATKAGALAFHEGLTSEIKHLYKARGIKTSVVHPNFVRTAMTAPHAKEIERTQKMMSVEDISEPVLKQIFSGRGGQLVLPARLDVLTGIRGWPNWIQEGFRDILGRASCR
jgi:NAD(P)-dependent dehydrogenase (short-subunit alcohol dehydrogenase family)